MINSAQTKSAPVCMYVCMYVLTGGQWANGSVCDGIWMMMMMMMMVGWLYLQLSSSFFCLFPPFYSGGSLNCVRLMCDYLFLVL